MPSGQWWGWGLVAVRGLALCVSLSATPVIIGEARLLGGFEVAKPLAAAGRMIVLDPLVLQPQ